MKNAGYLFSHWRKIERILDGKYIYLFLDYDGTLAPIAGIPARAFIPEKTYKALKGLSKLSSCKIAVVSGRSVRDVERLVGLKNIVYAGNHGFEIKGPKIKFKKSPRQYRKILNKIKDRLDAELSSIKGVLIEDKGFSLSVHYRLADKKDFSLIEAAFYSATLHYEIQHDIKVTIGKMVLEVRPDIDWDKGKAVLWILARQKLAVRGKKIEILPVYIGDDVTDEDAFESLSSRGLTISVGKGRNTKARFYLKDTKDVARFLRLILKALSG